MKDTTQANAFIPDSKQHAESVLNIYLARNPKPEYAMNATLLKIWQCILYLNPGLHPDEIDNPAGGWPAQYLPYAFEIRKRDEHGELNDEDLYPADAQWAGLCDQLSSLTTEEATRRQTLRDLMAEEPIDAHILENIDTREALGRISVFYTHRDSEGPYEKWCGQWFETWEAAESYRLHWAQELYQETNTTKNSKTEKAKQKR